MDSIGWWANGVTVIALLLLFAVLLTVQACVIRYVYSRALRTYQIVQDRFDKLELMIRTLFLRIEQPPILGEGWSIAYDQANLVAEEILRKQPSVMLEIGSGGSTVLWAACLGRMRESRLISFEADERYYQSTDQLLRQYGLMRDNVQLMLAPYKEYILPRGKFKWYDIGVLSTLAEPIDFLFIDGPPDTLQPLARYPALILLWERLAADALIILDDGSRKDEQAIVQEWLREFPQLEAHYVRTKKGTWVLRRKDG